MNKKIKRVKSGRDKKSKPKDRPGTGPVVEETHETLRWQRTSPVVKKALLFIEQTQETRKGPIQPQELLDWDDSQGRDLFGAAWDDHICGIEYRLHLARVFLNRFKYLVNGFRVRAHIHIRGDDEAGIQDGYYRMEDISERPDLRERVIAQLVTRLENLSKELKLWKLSAKEQRLVLKKVRMAMAEE